MHTVLLDIGPLSSTQKPCCLSWADISDSQILYAQGAGAGTLSENNCGGFNSINSRGKVSDLSSSSDPSLTTPVLLPYGPHNGAIVDGNGGGGGGGF